MDAMPLPRRKFRAVGLTRVFLHLADLFTVGLLLMPLLIPLSWWVSITRATKLARQLGDRQVAVAMDQEGITFETTERRSFTSWSALKEVWKFHDVWLFFPYGTGAGAFTAVPAEAFPAEAIELMSRKFQEYATRLRG
jgi:hypothetical protein